MIRPSNPQSKYTPSSGVTTTIPGLTRKNSTYAAGESSRRTKRSKRPTLQSCTPIVFNLDDDGHVRKVYDKYVGISEGIIKPYIAIIEQYRLLLTCNDHVCISF